MGWVETVVIILIIGLLLSGGLTVLMSTFKGVGDVLKGAVGLGDSIFSMLNDQMNTCKKHGFFAFWKGCIIGVGALGYLVAMGIGWLVRTYSSFRKVPVGADVDSPAYKAGEIARELGATASDVANAGRDAAMDAYKYLEDKGYTREANPEMYNAAMNASVAEAIYKKAMEMTKNVTDVESRKKYESLAENIRVQAKQNYEEDTKDMSEDDRKATDEAVKAGGGGFEPFPS